MDPFLRNQGARAFESAIAVTPANANLVWPSGDQNRASQGVLVGGAGNLVVLMADGTGPITLTIPATACGSILPISVKQIQTATTATAIVAFA